jgi:replicative DNA helicase
MAAHRKEFIRLMMMNKEKKILDLLHNGDLIIIGGRPGNAKSMFGTILALSVAQNARHPVIYYEFQYYARNVLLSNLTGIPYKDILDFDLNEKDTSELVRVSKYLKNDIPFKIINGYHDSDYLDDIKDEYENNNELSLVVIDNPNFKDIKKLKEFATELNVPVILLLDLPDIDDVNMADVVILTHRQAFYEIGKPEYEIYKNEIDIIISKNKYGETETVKFPFYGEIRQIGDFAEKIIKK